MDKKPQTTRRDTSLSRERIIETAIAILDEEGESALTFRTLAQRLATGAGAIYWHVADKHDLLAAACDAVTAQTLAGYVPQGVPERAPEAGVHAIASGVFDMMEAHPWAGAALIRAGGQGPLVRILESLGRQVQAMGVAHADQWATVSALLNYILGVAGQNAANMQLARSGGVERAGLLDAMAAAWSGLDAGRYPFVRSMAGDLRAHDDRLDFLAGIDLILRGIRSGA